ncbi:putative transcriptional corepressor [Paramicrosporidium saccamoebae]|uniref:Putative transcriptional corepressor n=1 Tax=Paramicrosporidium saccamoebae TaxID=1246581 RepID=A0A2H9TIL2_9FUNG|nr:putative transcriptional corepressor [Paramicrosporidium saccamoebae]
MSLFGYLGALEMAAVTAVQVHSGEENSAGESVARQIAAKKKIPSKGTLFKLLLSAIQQIRDGRMLFDSIERLCRTPYDHDNPAHRKLLVRLWTAWKTDPLPEIPSEEWKELGFQGTDPATDFRAMGLFALHCIVVFAESKNGKSIYKEAQYGPYWYSFAVVAVNVADAIHRYLRDDRLHCSDMTMVDAEFIRLMTSFHSVWMQSKPENFMPKSGASPGDIGAIITAPSDDTSPHQLALQHGHQQPNSAATAYNCGGRDDMAASRYTTHCKRLFLASTAQLMGETERTQAALETVLRHNPYHVGAFVSLGHLLHNQRQYLQAAESYQKAISLVESQSGSNSPLLTTVWASLAHCWLLLEDLPRAFQAYQQALGYPGGARDSTLWFGVGLLYDRYAANEHALEAFSAVLKLEAPKQRAVPSAMMREVYFRVGMLLRFRKNYDAALACFDYVSIFPPAPLQRADVKLQMAVTFDAKNDPASARIILERNVIKDNRPSVAARGKALLGWILVRSGPPGEEASPEQEHGLQLLRQVVIEETGDALAWYYLGRAYVYRKMYTQSYEAYQEAVYRDSQNAAFWNSIGILYLEIHQFRDALDAFSRAIHQNPSIAEVWWNLGILYESCNNQINDAIDAYQRAAELDPTNVSIRNRILLRKAVNNGTSSTPIPVAVPMELDPLPYLMRPILLGTTNLPLQKSGPPSTAMVTSNPSAISPSIPGQPPRMNISARPRPHSMQPVQPSHPASYHSLTRPLMRSGMPPPMVAPRFGYGAPTRPNGLRLEFEEFEELDELELELELKLRLKLELELELDEIKSEIKGGVRLKRDEIKSEMRLKVRLKVG